MIVIVSVFYGAVCGAMLVVAGYALGFCIELLNCTCQIVQCHFKDIDSVFSFWSIEDFRNAAIFMAIAGGVIGLIYGIYVLKTENDEYMAKVRESEAQNSERLRKELAVKINELAVKSKAVCVENQKACQELVSSQYYSDDRIESIIDSISKYVQLQSQLEAKIQETESGDK